MEIKEHFSETYIIFKKTGIWKYLFIIIDEEGTAQLLVKKTEWYRLKPVTLDTLRFAEWNGFADPFELSLSIQRHIYEAVKKYFINKNAYISDYENTIMLKYGAVLDEYNELEPEEYTDDEDNDEGGDVASDETHTEEPFSQTSYLDHYFDRYR